MNSRFKAWRHSLAWTLPMVALLAGCTGGDNKQPKTHALATYSSATWEALPAVSDADLVAAARVMIALPDPTPFIRDQRPTTASVVLKLKPTATFSRAKAVRSMVSASRAGSALRTSAANRRRISMSSCTMRHKPAAARPAAAGPDSRRSPSTEAVGMGWVILR